MKEPKIPNKLFFRIGEVCELTGVKQHVLRYWESEFKIISPQRAKSKQRLYRRVDVENIIKIKTLLKNEGFTISGAKKLLAKKKSKKSEPQIKMREESGGVMDLFNEIKSELLEIKDLLEC